MYCESNDKSKTTLQFGEETLSIAIKSEKFGSEIHRTPQYLDLELEPIPLDNLSRIIYPIQFSLEQFRFIYTMKNLGVYSEIIDITVDNNSNKRAVIFEESGNTGSGEVAWENKHLSELQFYPDRITAELEDANNGQYKDSLKNILKEEKCTSAHSYTFLKWIEEIAKVLTSKDSVDFSIKDDHPMKIEIKFKNLGETSLLYFLAPRVLETTLEEDEEFDDF